MTIREVRELARKRPEREFVLNRLYGAHVSPFFTVVCLRLGLSPDQVTIVGAGFGILGIGLLFLPVGPWSIAGVAALQVGYILDFSDGQVARLTGRASVAGAYLDWLTHFYIPVGAALATTASLVGSGAPPWILVLGSAAALELAAFAFSCRDHILLAMVRDDPRLGGLAPFQAALADDARPDDVVAAGSGPAVAGRAAGIAGRRHVPSLRSIVGELLIYPGAVHLLTIVTIADAIAFQGQPLAGRAALVAAWAALLFIHVPLTVRRNYRVIQAVESVAKR